MAANDLVDDGYLGPIALLTRDECARLAAYLRREDLPTPHIWSKGRAVQERPVYELATRPDILGPVVEAVGPDVVLWGASAVRRRPSEAHPWHSDIESCGPEGGFVSVWIGIENTSRESSLQVIRGSHRLGLSVQEARSALGVGREEATPKALLEFVRARDPQATLESPDMENGDAIFFDGRLWHGTANLRSEGVRTALVLQYAASDRPVRIPDWSELDWPFHIRADPLPPVIVVHGTNRGGPNHVVPPPPPSSPGPP
jgi:hypothetical protein